MSVVYSIACAECGKDLNDFSCELDSGEDLIVKVHPCENCLTDKYDEGVEAGKELES